MIILNTSNPGEDPDSVVVWILSACSEVIEDVVSDVEVEVWVVEVDVLVMLAEEEEDIFSFTVNEYDPLLGRRSVYEPSEALK